MGHPRFTCGRVSSGEPFGPAPVRFYIIANPMELFGILYGPGFPKNGDFDLARVLEFRFNPLADVSG